MNALFHGLRSGCAWRMLPQDFPPWQTVYPYFRPGCQDGTWERMNEALRTELRQADGREAQPSAAVIDTPSVKTTETPGERGFDAGKKVKGRKRPLLVETMGLRLMVWVQGAHIQDRDGAQPLWQRAQPRFSRLRLMGADGIYAGPLVDWGRASAAGCWRSSRRIRRSGASRFCPADGWWSGRWVGWDGIAV